MTDFATTDLCDDHSDHLQIAEPALRNYGGRSQFHGPISTLKVFEDNTLVRKTLEQPGEGKVLVVDGGGSHRCALLGDQIAELAVNNGWAGVVIYGCIRDSADIAGMDIGVRALNTHPLKSVKRGEGQENIPVRFLGVTFTPGHHLYADEDGVIVSEKAL
jgi:regulator of ribonuclease activity A